MVKEILLTQGKTAIVDDEDFDKVKDDKWCAHKEHGGIRFYAQRGRYDPGKKRTIGYISMHHQVTDFKYKMIDHINGNGLDNRKCNLRPCNSVQNGINRKRLQKRNTSGLRGVSWHKRDKIWQAYINDGTKKIMLGYFNTKKEAALARDKKAKELHGEFAVLNFPREK